MFWCCHGQLYVPHFDSIQFFFPSFVFISLARSRSLVFVRICVWHTRTHAHRRHCLVRVQISEKSRAIYSRRATAFSWESERVSEWKWEKRTRTQSDANNGNRCTHLLYNGRYDALIALNYTRTKYVENLLFTVFILTTHRVPRHSTLQQLFLACV